MWHGLWWIVRVIKARKTGHAPANNEESSVVLVWPNDGDIHIKRTLYYLHIHYITSHHITVHDMTLQCIPAHYNIQYIASILACCKDCKSNIFFFSDGMVRFAISLGFPSAPVNPPKIRGLSHLRRPWSRAQVPPGHGCLDWRQLSEMSAKLSGW